jgi:hypothetical protein
MPGDQTVYTDPMFRRAMAAIWKSQ